MESQSQKPLENKQKRSLSIKNLWKISKSGGKPSENRIWTSQSAKAESDNPLLLHFPLVFVIDNQFLLVSQEIFETENPLLFIFPMV